MGEVVNQAKTFSAFLLTYKNRIAASLPQTVQKYLTPERLMSISMQATQRTPELLQCHPLSVVNAIIYLAQLGLEPRPRQAYLIPFGKDCVPVIDYRGLVDLARRSKMVLDVGAAAVYEADEFDYSLGSKPFLHHKPMVWIIDGKTGKRKPIESKDRGEMICTWCQPFYTSGQPATPTVLAIPDIERIRSKSRAKDSGPWKTDPIPMAIKTAVRAGMNLMPMSTDYMMADDIEEAVERGAPLPMLLGSEIADLMPEAEAITTTASPAEPAPAAAAPASGGLTHAGRALKERMRKATGTTGAPPPPDGDSPPAPAPQAAGGQNPPAPIPTQAQKVPVPIPWTTDEERTDTFLALRNRLWDASDNGVTEYGKIMAKHGARAPEYDPFNLSMEDGERAYHTLLRVVELAEQVDKRRPK